MATSTTINPELPVTIEVQLPAAIGNALCDLENETLDHI
jgi:hypothetical protein